LLPILCYKSWFNYVKIEPRYLRKLPHWHDNLEIVNEYI
jgi:hypothetical protein